MPGPGRPDVRETARFYFGRGQFSTRRTSTLNSNAIPLLASRRHAEVRYDAGQNQFFIRDNRSTNGTYLNFKLIQPDVDVPLSNGTTVSFGGPQYVIRNGVSSTNPFIFSFTGVLGDHVFLGKRRRVFFLMLKVIVQLSKWRKRATERVFHPDNMTVVYTAEGGMDIVVRSRTPTSSPVAPANSCARCRCHKRKR